jgi:hypothetical protein
MIDPAASARACSEPDPEDAANPLALTGADQASPALGPPGAADTRGADPGRQTLGQARARPGAVSDHGYQVYVTVGASKFLSVPTAGVLGRAHPGRCRMPLLGSLGGRGERCLRSLRSRVAQSGDNAIS